MEKVPTVISRQKQLRVRRGPVGDLPRRGMGLVLPVMIAGCLAFAPATVAPIRAEAPAISAEQFLEQAPPSWKRYREQFAKWTESISGTVTTEGVRTLPSRQVLWDYSMRVVTDNGRTLVDITREAGAANRGVKHTLAREAYGVNQKYAFNLQSRSAADPSDRLIVQRLEHPIGDGVQRWLGLHLKDLRYASLIELPMGALDELCLHPGFRITDVEAAASAGRGVRIEFEFSANEDKSKPFWGLKSGTLELDSENEWCLLAADFVVFLEDQWVDLSTDIEPQVTDAEGILVARSVWQEYSGATYGGYSSAEYALDANSRDVPEKTFQLSAFGLDEPVFKDRGRTSATLLLAVNGVALLAIGAYLLFKKHRQRGAEG